MRLQRAVKSVMGIDLSESGIAALMLVKKAALLLKLDGELIVWDPSALTIISIKVWFGGCEKVHSDHTFNLWPKTLSALLGQFGLLPVHENVAFHHHAL